MSAFGSKADIRAATSHVRFTPKSGHWQRTSPCPLWANSGLMQRSKKDRYSITSLASEDERYFGDAIYHSHL
jgi:hypothetical protein